MSHTPPEDFSSEQTISVPVELDDDGFLRRECPHCEREFKWLPADSSEPMQVGGYHCPYCDQQADQWFTKAQIDYVEAVGMHEFVEPLLHEFEQSFKRPKRGGRGMISARFERADTPTSIKPREPNDMRRVDFRCHFKEPIKVLET